MELTNSVILKEQENYVDAVMKVYLSPLGVLAAYAAQTIGQ